MDIGELKTAPRSMLTTKISNFACSVRSIRALHQTKVGNVKVGTTQQDVEVLHFLFSFFLFIVVVLVGTSF